MGSMNSAKERERSFSLSLEFDFLLPLSFACWIPPLSLLSPLICSLSLSLSYRVTEPLLPLINPTTRQHKRIWPNCEYSLSLSPPSLSLPLSRRPSTQSLDESSNEQSSTWWIEEGMLRWWWWWWMIERREGGMNGGSIPQSIDNPVLSLQIASAWNRSGRDMSRGQYSNGLHQ